MISATQQSDRKEGNSSKRSQLSYFLFGLEWAHRFYVALHYNVSRSDNQMRVSRTMIRGCSLSCFSLVNGGDFLPD